jgi:hypothetical protein
MTAMLSAHQSLQRVHARVRLVENGYVLYDWRTLKPLEISRAEIEQNIDLVIQAIVDIETHIPHLVDMLNWDDEIERLFSTVPDLSEVNENV